MTTMISEADRFRGALLGLACGDAIGTTVEFKPRGSFAPLTRIVGGGPFRLKAGEWTDDTSMALCLAESLLSCQGMDVRDQCERYVDWWLRGNNSPTGECFDIGNTVRSALELFRKSGDPLSGSNHPQSAGNGSIMRLAPVPMFFVKRYDELVQAAADSSRTTHGAKEAVDACGVLAIMIHSALEGLSKDQLLWPSWIVSSAERELGELSPAIRKVVEGSYEAASSEAIVGSGYVVKSLEAALWAFWKSDSFAEGALMAVNLGDDADTTGAIYGQLAGAFYGVQGIPEEWLDVLAWRERITEVADQLHAAALAGTAS